MTIRNTAIPACALLWVLFLFGSISAAVAGDREDAEVKVTEATSTFNDFVADPEMQWFRDNIVNAKAVLIIPRLLKAGFIFGGSGGTGVVLAHDTEANKWAGPAFYTMGSVSWGLQIGGHVAQVVLMAMTDKGKDALLSNKFQIGGDISVAVGPVGAGAAAATTDIVQFSRTKGAFGGLTLEGAVIAVRDSYNGAYYGEPVSPVDILVEQTVSNSQAEPLVRTVSSASK